MENPLAFLKSRLSALPFLSRAPESVLGVDVGSSSIKIAQLKKRRGVAVLETYGELALGPYAGVEIGRATNLPAQKIAEALGDLMREANVTTKSAGLSIPFASSLISLLELPPVSEKQLATMVPIEARKYIPVPITEVALDWFVVPPEETGETRDAAAPKKANVLLVAIHNDTLAKYREVAAQSGLETSFFEIEIFSAIRGVLAHGIAPVAVVDFGAATTKLYVVEYGLVKLSHIINKGSQDVTLAISQALGVPVGKAEELKRAGGLAGASAQAAGAAAPAANIVDYILAELARVLLAYQSRSAKNVATVVLTGGGAALKGLATRAKERLEREIVLADPFAKTEAPAFLADVLKEVGPSFSVAVGLALRKLQEVA